MKRLVASWWEVYSGKEANYWPCMRDARVVMPSRPSPLFMASRKSQALDWAAQYRREWPALGKSLRVMRVRRYRKSKP